LPTSGANGLMIATPCYGLANRLRLIGSAKVIADALGKEFRFVWDRRGDMPKSAHWHDLFEPAPGIAEIGAAGVPAFLTLRCWSLPFLGRHRLHALGGLPPSRKAAHEFLHQFTTHDNTPFACAHRLQTKPCSTHAELSVIVDPRWRHISLRGQFNYKLVTMSDDEYVRRMGEFYRSLQATPTVQALAHALTSDFTPRVALDNPARGEILAASDSAITIGVHCRQTDNSQSFYEGMIPEATYHAHIDRAV
jgi:hypothetical protein